MQSNIKVQTKFRQAQQPKIDKSSQKSVDTLGSVEKFDKRRKMARNIWGENNGEKLVKNWLISLIKLN